MKWTVEQCRAIERSMLLLFAVLSVAAVVA